jgi:hypothetical protein
MILVYRDKQLELFEQTKYDIDSINIQEEKKNNIHYIHKVHRKHSECINKVDILEVFENKLVEFEIDEDYYNNQILFKQKKTIFIYLVF